ncbi:hypothetical protein MMC25_004061 [Agyrium rufum]|nr:hypothetical protein [Agyrium rufum]
MSYKILTLLLLNAMMGVQAQTNFTIVNGQIYTPGIAIVDSPQPYTPLGGDILQVALDISGDGRLPQRDWNTATPPSTDSYALYNLTIFLTSYTVGVNFTIANGSYVLGGGGNPLAQEPGSTVKHVNWVWPECFIGNGGGQNESNTNGVLGEGGARGDYNISIHQTFHYNTSSSNLTSFYYTIFTLPIQTTNSIPQNLSQPQPLQYAPVPHPPGIDYTPTVIGTRPDCAGLTNPLLSYDDLLNSTTPFAGVGWVGLGSGTVVVEPSTTVVAGGSPTETLSGGGGGGGQLDGAGALGVDVRMWGVLTLLMMVASLL